MAKWKIRIHIGEYVVKNSTVEIEGDGQLPQIQPRFDLDEHDEQNEHVPAPNSSVPDAVLTASGACLVPLTRGRLSALAAAGQEVDNIDPAAPLNGFDIDGQSGAPTVGGI